MCDPQPMSSSLNRVSTTSNPESLPGIVVSLVVLGLFLRYVAHPEVPRFVQPLPGLSLGILGVAFWLELPEPWIPLLIVPFLVSLIVAGSYARRGVGGPAVPLLASWWRRRRDHV